MPATILVWRLRGVHRHTRLQSVSERGSITIWIINAALVMIVLVGLTVDLSGQVYAQQHARDMARQAARAGGQQLQAGPAIRGERAVADQARAVRAARAYLAASNVKGSAKIIRGDTVDVTTSTVYRTKFLSIINIDQRTVTGHGQATIARVSGGVRR